MRPIKICLRVLCLSIVLHAYAPDVMAERLEQASVLESSWTFNAYIDFWIPKAPLTMSIDGNIVERPENLNTILDSMKLFAALRFNAHKGPLGVFVNPIVYKGTWDKVKVQLPLEERDGSISESVWLVDYGMSYQIGRWDLGQDGKSRVVSLEPYAGFRFLHDNITLEVEPGLIGDGFVTHKTISSNAPIIGLQSSFQLNDNWDFLLQGDYGGFDVDDMDNTYLMASYFNYDFKWRKLNSKFFFGYRFLHLEIDHKAEDVALKVNVQGPILGLGFAF